MTKTELDKLKSIHPQLSLAPDGRKFSDPLCEYRVLGIGSVKERRRNGDTESYMGYTYYGLQPVSRTNMPPSAWPSCFSPDCFTFRLKSEELSLEELQDRLAEYVQAEEAWNSVNEQNQRKIAELKQEVRKLTRLSLKASTARQDL